ncbi:MAG: type 4a pilus biogenesis protein PilO [Candidatus Omnitrophica bacterium]|nr:type 4a pilus biogenesis protein PilO [Candidatus Omnitrophota bacterium]MBU4590290.1 type 4a pilus biogenesis protein PilO [Candidatus Omnitrophota bacterium]
MKKRENKKPNSIIVMSAVIVLATLAIGVLLIFMPFLNNRRSLRASILNERDRNVLLGTVRALDKHLKVYEDRVPEGRGVSWLLNEVSNMAAKEKIEVSSIKPGSPEDRGSYTKLYVTLDTISDYHKLGKFIASIESSGKFLKVEDIKIKRLDFEGDFKEDESDFSAFDAKGHIVISTFVLKE